MNIVDNRPLACGEFWLPERDRSKEKDLHEPGIPDPRAAQTSKLTRLAFHKNGPKSYKRGQGALLNALLANDGTTQRELVKTMGMDRSDLKGIVKKAERNGYVTIEDAEGERTYAVKLTDEGREVAQKRVAANDKTADDIIGCLSEEEIAQL
ncbi:MAG: MarR family winged helix-turn-helix transcriptional regulator, partial [Eggerthellaceae bacterium]